ncbi:hypothetical protein [Pseudomonas aeruginosa]|uniref:hypothetical protein n=1 Tax=Pseudomonas aeruginosa TaxID=287 RepID=UPI00073C78E2|nr:hypothetical protein [Pseudomonas aeruginosa]PNN33406.1 hypothetical protein AL512_002140 [Pseudomonas aeruginosa]HEJ9768739.1 hypothetical protein [Pseudomonas aeruginosa]HEO1712391.1 hypothetical protein [Pseudomonas aeruginosa]
MFKNSKGQLVTAEEAAADLNAQLDEAEKALQLEKYKSPLDERAAFEAHESKERRLSPADQRTWFRRGAIADYDCKAIDDAWKAWQARAALPTEPLSIQFVNAVKQLCKDFSDRQDRPYMGDVYSALDALLVNEGIQVAEEPFPSPQKQSKPCGECRLPEGERCDICGAKATA